MEAVACGQDAGTWLFGSRKFFILNNGRDIDKFSFKPENRQLFREKFGLKNEMFFGTCGGLC